MTVSELVNIRYDNYFFSFNSTYVYVHKCVEKSAESQGDRIEPAALNIYRT